MQGSLDMQESKDMQESHESQDSDSASNGLLGLDTCPVRRFRISAAAALSDAKRRDEERFEQSRAMKRRLEQVESRDGCGVDSMAGDEIAARGLARVRQFPTLSMSLPASTLMHSFGFFCSLLSFVRVM